MTRRLALAAAVFGAFLAIRWAAETATGAFSSPGLRSACFAAVYLTALAALAAACRRLRPGCLRVLRAPATRSVPWLAAAGLLTAFVAVLMPGWGAGAGVAWERLVRGAAGDALLLAVIVAGEELVFRGLLFDLLGGRLRAVLVTSLLFGAVHVHAGSPLWPADVAVLGLTLGVLRFRTGALWAPFAFHLGWDLGYSVLYTAVADGLLRLRFGSWPAPEAAPTSAGALVAAALVTIAVVTIAARQRRRPAGGRQLSAER